LRCYATMGQPSSSTIPSASASCAEPRAGLPRISSETSSWSRIEIRITGVAAADAPTARQARCRPRRRATSTSATSASAIPPSGAPVRRGRAADDRHPCADSKRETEAWNSRCHQRSARQGHSSVSRALHEQSRCTTRARCQLVIEWHAGGQTATARMKCSSRRSTQITLAAERFGRVPSARATVACDLSMSTRALPNHGELAQSSCARSTTCHPDVWPRSRPVHPLVSAQREYLRLSVGGVMVFLGRLPVGCIAIASGVIVASPWFASTHSGTHARRAQMIQSRGSSAFTAPCCLRRVDRPGLRVPRGSSSSKAKHASSGGAISIPG